MSDKQRLNQGLFGAKIARRDFITRSLAFGASVGGIGAALSACGGTSSTSSNVNGPVTLNFMRWASDGGFPKHLAAVTTVYPELAHIHVDVKITGQADTDVASALRLALAANKNIPDFVMINRTELAEFANSGALMQLDDAFSSAKSDLFSGALEVVSYQGKIYGFPLEVKSKMFYYRADMYDQANIQLTDLNTIDGFIEAGQKFHAKFPKSYLLNLGTQPQQYFLDAILSAYPGITFADPSGNFQITKNQAFADAFSFFKRVHDSGIALPIDDFSNDWQQAFANETVGSVFGSEWIKFFLPGYAPGQQGKWKVAPTWPTLAPLADQTTGSENGGSLMVIPAQAPHAQQAIEVLSRMFLDRKGALAQFEDGTFSAFTPLLKSAQSDVEQFVNTTTRPASMSAADWAAEPQVFFGSNYQGIEFESYSHVKAIDYDPTATKEITILGQWLTKYLTGQASLNQALNGAQSDMQSQIGNPYNQ